MSYVTYMFTLYTSALPYLKDQTSFYSNVLHMNILQVRARARALRLVFAQFEGAGAALCGPALGLGGHVASFVGAWRPRH